jgi:hypothetical protein
MSSRKIVYTVFIIIVLFLTFVITGLLASEYYEGEIAENFPERQIDIWRNISSIETIPVRKPDVAHVTVFEEDFNRIAWREDLKKGRIRNYRIVEMDSPNKLTIELFESSNGITGTWEFYLGVTDTGKTRLTIKEKSYNQNMWLRAYYTIMGRDILLRRELKSLRVSLFQRLLEMP